MDQFTWLIAEILVQQRERELAAHPYAPSAPARRDGLRRALATTMVRLGLRLDPAAGERLAGADAFAHQGRP